MGIAAIVPIQRNESQMTAEINTDYAQLLQFKEGKSVLGQASEAVLLVSEEAVLLFFGRGDNRLAVNVMPLGWRQARTWTKLIKDTFKTKLPLVQNIDSLMSVDIATEAGLQAVVNVADQLMDELPDEVFNLVAAHPQLAQHREIIEELGTTIQVLTAFKEVLQLEVPLGELAGILGTGRKVLNTAKK